MNEQDINRWLVLAGYSREDYEKAWRDIILTGQTSWTLPMMPENLATPASPTNRQIKLFENE